MIFGIAHIPLKLSLSALAAARLWQHGHFFEHAFGFA
jgi:hypothetical protein